MKEIKLKFKDGVFGFVYDAMYGDIMSVITEPMSEETIKFFNKYCNEDQVLFTTTDDLAELFGIETETYVTEYWGDILETVK